MEDLLKFFSEFQWFISLGGVVVVSTIITIFLVKLERVTILKNSLSSATSSQKDSILGLAGTLTSLIIYAIVYFASEMIIQGKFMIDFQGTLSAVSIPAGAAVTWVSAKGIYTVFHKWWQRVKEGKSLDVAELSKDIDAVEDAVKSEQANPTTIKSQIGTVKKGAETVAEVNKVTKGKKIL